MQNLEVSVYVLICTNLITMLFLARVFIYKNEVILEKEQIEKDLSILISELEVELQNKKKEVNILDGKLNEELLKNEQLDTEVEYLKNTLKEKLKEYDSRYQYLNNFLNNGIFYDKQNDTMVLISELVRVADLENVEENEEKSVD